MGFNASTPIARRIRVAVIFGGRSGEHEVSLASARSIMEAMNKTKYEILPIGIGKSGRWITTGDPMAVLSSSDTAEKTDSELAAEERTELATTTAIYSPRRELVPGTVRHGFPVVDVVFPVLHGPYGEDGTVQGVLELAGIPYVGAGVLGSALGLDKVAQKAVFAANGLPIVEYRFVSRADWRRVPEQIIARLERAFNYPVFVKPANLGSSVGVSKAHDRRELGRGLNLAAQFDRRLVVERAVNAREIECSVLGNDQPIASVLGEVVPSNEFYDYRAKYIDDNSELHIPADLPPDTTKQIQTLAVAAFRAIDCAGMARADFFVCRDTGEIYVNELNTIPGFTSISMYPKLWQASGLAYAELIDRLIELALERYRDSRECETAYAFDH